jgi:hypothetical protein
MSAPAPSMYSPAAKAVAEKLGLKMGRANLEEFADTLLALAKTDRNILAVTSDSRGSGKLGPFGQALPKQIVEVGIAEQNLVGIAAGLGSCGKNVFAVSPACFLTARSLEQVKNDICYSDHPVTIVGISSGVSYGALGSTHHSLHDFAVMRAIHNLTIVVPADNFETREAVKAAAASRKPVYLRFGKARSTRCRVPTPRRSPSAAPACFARATTSRFSPPAKPSSTPCSPPRTSKRPRVCAAACELADVEAARHLRRARRRARMPRRRHRRRTHGERRSR